MKKVIFTFLGLFVVIAIVALSVLLIQQNRPNEPVPTSPTGITTVPSTTSPQITTVPTEPTVPTESIPETEPLRPLASVSLPIITELDYADDGTVIFTYTFQDVVLNLTDPQISQVITLDLLQRMDANSARIEHLQDVAFRDYIGQTMWRSYYYSLLFGAKRIDSAVLSLYGYEEWYGNGESETGAIALNYDLTSGQLLTLEDVVRADAHGSLLQALLRSLQSQYDALQLYDDYADIITSDFESYFAESGTWYLGEEGLCFLFSPYYIAPHSAGILSVTVPYSELQETLLPSYLPEETTTDNGDLHADALDQVDLDQFTQFTEFKMLEGISAVVHSDSLIGNVMLEQGHLVAGVRYEKDAEVFLANRLTPEDALLLQIRMDEETVWKLHYSAGGTRFTFLLKADDSGNLTITIEE